MIDPALVHQVVNLASTGGLQLDLAEGTGVLHVGRRAGSDLQNQGLAGLVIEHLAHADAVGQLDAVNGADDVAGPQADAAAIGRSALENLRDFDTRTVIAFVEDQSQLRGRLFRRRAKAENSQMRGVQLAHHEAHQGI